MAAATKAFTRDKSTGFHQTPLLVLLVWMIVPLVLTLWFSFQRYGWPGHDPVFPPAV